MVSVEEDIAQDQQAYQAAVAATSGTRHCSFAWLTLLGLPDNMSTGAVLRELGTVSLS